jgi:hypothetical protein
MRMHAPFAAPADVWIRRTTTVSVVLVAGIAAVVSYQHMHELAVRHGESWLGATLIPLAVDGMIVASSMSVLHASRCGRRGGALPWVLLLVGSLASLGANVAVADPTLIARIIAAWPSFALIGAYEMLTARALRNCIGWHGDGLRITVGRMAACPPVGPSRRSSPAVTDGVVGLNGRGPLVDWNRPSGTCRNHDEGRAPGRSCWTQTQFDGVANQALSGRRRPRPRAHLRRRCALAT